MPPVVVISCPGLESRMIRPETTPALDRIRRAGVLAALRPPLPAVTMPVQATLTTGLDPSAHGIVWNGVRIPELGLVSPWEQPAGLVRGERIWDALRQRRPGARVAVLFWQLALGAPLDVLLTPKPVHLPDGRVISRCDATPETLYDEMAKGLGPFPLHRYWGPLASSEASGWIAEATAHVLARFRPDLALTYLPALDYPLQREGPGGPGEAAALTELDRQVAVIAQEGAQHGYAVVVVGEYRIVPVTGALFPNLALRKAGLLSLRRAEGRTYLDTLQSRAFAICDHQAAHVFCADAGARDRTLGALAGVPGIRAFEGRRRAEVGLDTPAAGDIVLFAAPDRWLAYRWWEDPAEAPAFAATVDIHQKPGYDPLELFLAPDRRGVAQDEGLVKGSHGAPADGGKPPVAALLLPKEAEASGEVACRAVPGLITRLVAGA